MVLGFEAGAAAAFSPPALLQRRAAHTLIGSEPGQGSHVSQTPLTPKR